MAADRAQHVADVVRPALAQGRHVVSDRYAASSIAYQGFGRGLDLSEVRRLSDWATDGLWPDLTILLDVPIEVAADRLGHALDRFEQAGHGFHRRVIDGFRELAAADAATWVVVDGTADVDVIAATVRGAVRERLQLPA
jgi:dTMP kinase